MVLGDAEDDIVFQHVEGVVHGVHCQVGGPLEAHLQESQGHSEASVTPLFQTGHFFLSFFLSFLYLIDRSFDLFIPSDSFILL